MASRAHRRTRNYSVYRAQWLHKIQIATSSFIQAVCMGNGHSHLYPVQGHLSLISRTTLVELPQQGRADPKSRCTHADSRVPSFTIYRRRTQLQSVLPVMSAHLEKHTHGLFFIAVWMLATASLIHVPMGLIALCMLMHKCGHRDRKHQALLNFALLQYVHMHKDLHHTCCRGRGRMDQSRQDG